MNTDYAEALALGWRNIANEKYLIYCTAKAYPALFQPWYEAEIKIDFHYAADRFEFWQRWGLDTRTLVV